MKKGFFLYEFLRNPKAVGAVWPSTCFLAEQMVASIQFKQANYIVEYGPGTGVFTDKLLQKRQEDTVLLLVEQNPHFYQLLKEKYKREKNLLILNGSAENIEAYLQAYHIPYADYVLSGLPFASLPKEVSSKILTSTVKILRADGRFITFQYTKLKKLFIEQFFPVINVKREFKNFPPAYILNCGTLEEDSGGVSCVENTSS